MKDCFGIEADDIKSKKLWLFDMDGTVYKDGNVFEGSLELLYEIKRQGGRYVFITNNSSCSVIDYVRKVRKLGIEVDEDNFFTSSQATVLWLFKNCPDAKIYCQGTKSLVNELRSSGINVTENIENIDVVLIGFDTELTSEKLRNTCEILCTQNVTYIATNPDLVCPSSFGYVPDCGSLCQIIKNATNKFPKFIGKPERIMVDFVREKFAYDVAQTIVVGDRLYTDIATGINAGVTSVCVLTGEATIESIKNSDLKPNYTFRSVKDLWHMLQTT